MALSRGPLRDEVYSAIAKRIVRNELAPGSRLSDTALAKELGVSRTPVREALVQLEREGFLDAEVGRGFFVAPLSAAKLREAAPIFWTLEGLALRAASPLSAPVLDELDEIAAETARSLGDPQRVVWLNLRWHQLLVEGCGNEHLLGLLDGFARVLRRYAFAYWHDTGRADASVELHQRVAASLRAGDLDAAAAMLEQGWREATERMASSIDETKAGDPE
ncbi:MAG TPA: GntR family transcriptional regulator [Longimicrobiaceae bacterium]|jgi:DNA-binding GntR family transcriptional regulator|nr:GntR family transcriptional regulator [Longimicrobiaceae bacterium]